MSFARLGPYVARVSLWLLRRNVAHTASGIDAGSLRYLIGQRPNVLGSAIGNAIAVRALARVAHHTTRTRKFARFTSRSCYSMKSPWRLQLIGFAIVSSGHVEDARSVLPRNRYCWTRAFESTEMCGQVPGSLSHRRVEAIHRDLDADQVPLGGHGLGRRHRII
jgi:hypothetical protein